ncbi:MAG: SGNH/GDSL hydrolase family protein, partial [Ginsengibacter sp.]
HMGTEVPNPDFDMDNEGHAGWRFDNFFNPPDWDKSDSGNLKTWLQIYTPDIVLMELGTNDVFQCRKVKDMIKDLSTIIELLRKKNNNVKIFVAQIPPLGPQWSEKKLCNNDTAYAQVIMELNKAIASFTNKDSTPQSPVIAVDQFTGIDPKTDMFDDIHPNEKGEKIMAERWFEKIKPFLEKV